jgi:hypothetical protein
VRRAAISALAALALSAACVLPPAAASAAGSAEFRAGLHLHRGRYEVSVQGLGPSIYMTVATGTLRSQKRVAATAYVARGTATESRLEASFGELGEISMRFHPSPKRTWVKPDRRCRGAGRYLVRHGDWEGTLRFRGEEDYLSLDVHRARGEVETVAPSCRRAGSATGRGPSRRDLIRPSQEPALGPEVPVILASWRQGIANASFGGGASEEGSIFLASTQESRGPIAIFRAARALGPASAMSADAALTSAHVSPPAPFHGSATFHAAPDGTRTWSGGLFVSFPGASHYALTGEPFEPRLELLPELLLGALGLFSSVEHQPSHHSRSRPADGPKTDLYQRFSAHRRRFDESVPSSPSFLVSSRFQR